MKSNRITNELANEQSPYLLQHADNPVGWYPWCPEAFKKAEEGDKPIFLSIGYSTCHWCHVMAHESFEDQQVAKLLNQHFVSVKVDREERPDIDAVYMAACQALTGSGGWPLTIIMTPGQKPFYAGTYLPKNSRYGALGLMELLTEIAQLWKKDRSKVIDAGNEITQHLQKHRPVVHGEPDKQLFENALTLYAKSFDSVWGGFGPAPKFPSPHNLLFLLHYWQLTKNPKAYNMAKHTLDQMYRGGLFDHIGGGFSRYSTDEKWLVPHFEKMLYDNGLLAYAYTEFYQASKEPFYRRVTESIFQYVLKELTHPQGGFYCGQDADSEGVEGKYYVFTPSEIKKILGSTDGDAFCQWFGITEAGNFEGKSIPNLIENDHYKNATPELQKMCAALYDYRKKRVALHKDDKILTSWNGLMIAAFARASFVLSSPELLKAAEAAHNFIRDHLMDEAQNLLVRWRENNASNAGHLDDYAFYAFSLLELYRATFDMDYIKEAVIIGKKMIAHFFDETEGGFYLYGNQSEQLISRPKETYDGAMPSGNSVAALVMQRLFYLTGDLYWKEKLDLQIQYLTGFVKAYPAGYSFSLLTMLETLYPNFQLVCATAESKCPNELITFLRDGTYPFISVMIKNTENKEILAQTCPFTKDYPLPAKGTLYYLCLNGSCQSPVSNVEELRAVMEKSI